MAGEIIMGGSGSTGSSLLKNILNRNSEVFSGEETSLFAKRELYTTWSKSKKKLLRRGALGVRNFGWHIYNGADIVGNGYGWKKNELQLLISQSNSLQEFSLHYYRKGMELNQANVWLEKTPANSATFRFFLDEFQGGKVVHLVRNPYDTVASLWARGYNLFYAIGIYMLNTASGRSVSKSSRSHQVKYEDLVNLPVDCVSSVCKFLNVDFKREMLQHQGEHLAVSKLQGWNYDETGSIGSNSIGRFSNLTDEKQNMIMEAFNVMQINNRGKAYYMLEHSNIEDLCDDLGYDFYRIGSKRSVSSLKKLRNQDRFMRIRRGYASGIYYPIDII